MAVSGDSVIPDRTDTLTWEGRSFDAPPYYGWRATYWASPEFGYGLDFAHNKVYPKDDVLPAGYSKLEFTDGLNTLTVNAYRRWENAIAGLTPYVGGGVGLSIPHVEVVSGASETFGYQVTGPAATWIAGASYPISGLCLASTRAITPKTMLIWTQAGHCRPTLLPMRSMSALVFGSKPVMG